MSRLRFIRQHDSKQCGAACLAMVCSAYGKYVSINHIEQVCGAAKDGLSLLAVSESARILGFDTLGALMTIDSLKEIPLPAILYWDQKHYVVLNKLKKTAELKLRIQRKAF